MTRWKADFGGSPPPGNRPSTQRVQRLEQLWLRSRWFQICGMAAIDAFPQAPAGNLFDSNEFQNMAVAVWRSSMQAQLFAPSGLCTSGFWTTRRMEPLQASSFPTKCSVAPSKRWEIAIPTWPRAIRKSTPQLGQQQREIEFCPASPVDMAVGRGVQLPVCCCGSGCGGLGCTYAFWTCLLVSYGCLCGWPLSFQKFVV